MIKDTTLPISFTGRTEHFYVIRNEGLSNPAVPPKYAVYQSTDAYNSRTETPYYVEAGVALADFANDVKIYPESLTTTPPAYPNDRDETDYGLTPTLSYWHNLFERQREDRTHAA